MAPYDDTLNNLKNSVINKELVLSREFESEDTVSKPQISEIVKIFPFKPRRNPKIHGCEVEVSKDSEGSFLYNFYVGVRKKRHKNLKLKESCPEECPEEVCPSVEWECPLELEECPYEGCSDVCPQDYCPGVECPTEVCNCIANDECWFHSFTCSCDGMTR